MGRAGRISQLIFLLFKNTFDTIIMQEDSFVSQSLDLISCCNLISCSLFCLKMQVFFLKSFQNDNIYKIIVAFSRIFSVIGKHITAHTAIYIQSCFFQYLTTYRFLGAFACLCSASGNFPPAGAMPLFRTRRVIRYFPSGRRITPNTVK